MLNDWTDVQLKIRLMLIVKIWIYVYTFKKYVFIKFVQVGQLLSSIAYQIADKLLLLEFWGVMLSIILFSHSFMHAFIHSFFHWVPIMLGIVCGTVGKAKMMPMKIYSLIAFI